MTVLSPFSPQGRFADWRLATQSIIGFWAFYLVTVLLRGLFGPEAAVGDRLPRGQCRARPRPHLPDLCRDPAVRPRRQHPAHGDRRGRRRASRRGADVGGQPAAMATWSDPMGGAVQDHDAGRRRHRPARQQCPHRQATAATSWRSTCRRSRRSSPDEDAAADRRRHGHLVFPARRLVRLLHRHDPAAPHADHRASAGRGRNRGPCRAGPGAALPGQSALPVQHAQQPVLAGHVGPLRPRRGHADGAVDLLPHQPVDRPVGRRQPGRGDRAAAPLSRHREGPLPGPAGRRDRRSRRARAGARAGADPAADGRECDQIWRVADHRQSRSCRSRRAVSTAAGCSSTSSTGDRRRDQEGPRRSDPRGHRARPGQRLPAARGPFRQRAPIAASARSEGGYEVSLAMPVEDDD